MGRKEEYKEKNLQYLQVLSTQEGICPLPCNMFYKVLQTGTGKFHLQSEVLSPFIIGEV